MDLLERIAATGLLGDGRPVVVLLSGGRDSVCLLDLPAPRAGAVRAPHVTDGLRPDAEGDGAPWAALSARLEVPLSVERASRPDEAPGNLQAWARDARYAAAARLAGDGALVAAAPPPTHPAETGPFPPPGAPPPPPPPPPPRPRPAGGPPPPR